MPRSGARFSARCGGASSPGRRPVRTTLPYACGPGVSARPFARRHCARAGLWSAPRAGPHGCDPHAIECAPSFSPGARAPGGTRCGAVRARGHVCGRVSVAGTAPPAAHPHHWLPRRCSSSSPWRRAAPAASHPSGALSTDQWQSPVSSTARHVCLRERGESLHGRTLRPAYSGPFPGVCPGAPVSAFPSPASLHSRCRRDIAPTCPEPAQLITAVEHGGS